MRLRFLTPNPTLDPKIPATSHFRKVSKQGPGDKSGLQPQCCVQSEAENTQRKAGGSICTNDHVTIRGSKSPRVHKRIPGFPVVITIKLPVSILFFKNNKQNYPCNVILFFKAEWFKSLPGLAKGTYAGFSGGQPAVGLKAQILGPFTVGYGHTYTGSLK